MLLPKLKSESKCDKIKFKNVFFGKKKFETS